MSYLLDTDWAIEALGGRRGANTTLEELMSQGVAISWIAIGEIYEGAIGSPDSDAQFNLIRSFLQQLRILGLNDPIMVRFAEIRSHLRRQGQLIPDLDLLIAATALEHDLTLLTFNIRHFRRIPQLKLYL
jgi:predicted nucleic acid-binding protein